MNRYFFAALAFIGVIGVQPAFADPHDQQDIKNAETFFFAGANAADGLALNQVLDQDFSWTDADGKTYSRADMIKAPPKPRNPDIVNAPIQMRFYGNLAVVTSNRAPLYALRIWVKRDGAWRTLVYQEVPVQPTAASASASPAAQKCDNPCKTIPYKPKNETERGALAAWQALETAVAGGDAPAWMLHADYDFVVASNARYQNKRERAALVAQGGAPPSPLVSAELLDFPDLVIMRALHQPVAGKPVHATRLLIKKGSNWLMTMSYQTTVQAGK